MPKTKKEKAKILEELKRKLEKQKIVLFLNFAGLKARDFSILREKIKLNGDEIKVVKKTLTRLAFKEKGIDVDVKKLEGELAIVFGFKDEVSPAKIVVEFSNLNPNLRILGGLLNHQFLPKEKVVELANLPTKENLLANLTNYLSAPISNFINVLEGNIKGLLIILNKLATKSG